MVNSIEQGAYRPVGAVCPPRHGVVVVVVQDVLVGSARVVVMMHVFIKLLVGVMEVILQSIRVVFHERVFKRHYMRRRVFFVHF